VFPQSHLHYLSFHRSMKSVIVLALCTVCGFAPARADATNPIQKVLQLLSDLQAKIVKEGEAEQKVYEEFAEMCDDRSKEIGFEIKTGKAEVAELDASIAKETANMDQLASRIEDLSASISTDEADLKAATAIRAKEQADFGNEEADLVEVIDTLQRAIAILGREMEKGSASLMQLQNAGSLAKALSVMVQASAFSAADASRLTALVQSSQEPEGDDDDASLGSPDAAVYTGHSGGIIQTLNDLLAKAEGQLSGARKTETANLHNFELLKQSLVDGVKFANKDMEEAKSASAASGEAKATAEGDLAVTSKDLAADVKSLASLHHECMTGATEFEEATKSRGEELAALAEAKKVISEATGGAEKLTYGLDQVSFLQISRSQMFAGADLANSNEAIRFMRELARRHDDPALTQLASRMSSAIRFGASDGDDPFAKVKGLISDMIARLQADASADASHKAFCDKEMSESNAKKAEKDSEVAKLTTKIDQMTAKSAQLKEEVATLQKELAELAATQADMDKLRQEEKAAYDVNRPDMEQGLEGVKMALQVLRDYYAKDAKSHEAAEGAASGIVGLLEVVESDLSKGLAQIIATEEAAAAEYDQQTKENAITKTTKDQDVKYKTEEFTRLDKAVSDATADREGVQTELDAVLEYLEKLKEQCVAKAETYEERVSRREAELAGLREALQILEGEAVLLQKSSKHALRGSV